ncbi:hypothetical protein WBG78_14295 [Chryseolinea sp. T2]|uniref:hypothetical protein n=1 Tax=Chryseolinea sp. T2 TaxID=3129255 RepID=UPI0030774ED8
MTAQSYHTEDFQKEQVLRRLRVTAAQLWELPENETDELDPLVDLILGACAVEFERTSQDVYSSQSRILQRLASLMVPEVFTNARPAHGILHVMSEAPVTKLKRHDQFSIDKEVQNANSVANIPVVFSPVQPTPVFDGSIICQVAGKTITFFETPFVKKEKVVSDGPTGLQPWSLWLGVRLNKRITSLRHLTLFVDWRTDQDNLRNVSLLPFSKVFIGNRQLKIFAGVQTQNKAVLSELDTMSELEDHALNLYHSHFLTIDDETAPQFQQYPAEFASVFSAEQLKMFKDEVCWVRVEVSEGIPPAALNEAFCSINCVPVMNRKLHAVNRPYALSRNLNIIPLQHSDQFLCMNRVYSQKREYTAVNMQGVRATQDGAFAVRQGGVNRFDQRSASAQLTYLYELLRDESAAFTAYGIQALSAELKVLDQSLTRLESYFVQKGTRQPFRCHLLVNTRQAEDVWIEYWSTLGEVGNKISAGKKVALASGATVKRESAILMTATSGGRAAMTDGEKLHAYKYTLLTRSRVVTEEDLRTACFMQLGQKISNVIVRKGVRKNFEAKKGYVKTIDVVLVPASGFEQINWDEVCVEMQAFLDQRKSFTTSICVLSQQNN